MQRRQAIYTDRFDLRGKTALITGGTGHMGSHFSRGFAEAGAKVVVVSRTPSKQEQLVSEIRRSGGLAESLSCDLSNLDEVARMCEEAWALGPIEIVLHSAMPPIGPIGGLLDTPEDDWQLRMTVIYESARRMFKVLCPKMAANGGGSIISIVAPGGVDPIPGFYAYGMAKGSLMLLTRMVAREFGPAGIRANCISPHAILTGSSSTSANVPSELIKSTALMRAGRSEEVVTTALFLASNAASYITSQVIEVNGGRR